MKGPGDSATWPGKTYHPNDPRTDVPDCLGEYIPVPSWAESCELCDYADACKSQASENN